MPQTRKAPGANRSQSQSHPRKGGSRANGNGQPTGTKGAAQLVAAIEAAGYKVTGSPPHWMVQCPFHEDGKPSCGIDVHTRTDEPCGWRVLINCHQCGKVGKRLSERFGVLWGDVLHHPDNRLLLERPPKSPARLPIRSQFLQWHADLENDELDYLVASRCIDVPTLELNMIGWDFHRQCYTLPVFEGEDIVNCRRYYRHLIPKMRGLAGRGIHLYPDVPDSDWLLLCEGELDALVGRSSGLPTLTSTGGACGWKHEWDKFFMDRDVAIIYDCDPAGRREALKRANSLLTTAGLFDRHCRVKVVDLAPDRSDGYDLGDWFKKHSSRDLLRSIKRSAPLDGREGVGRDAWI